MYPCTSYSAAKGRIVFQYIIVLGMTHLKTREYVATINKLLILPFSEVSEVSVPPLSGGRKWQR